MKKRTATKSHFSPLRHWSLLILLFGSFVVLGLQAGMLQWEQGEFLKQQGEARVVRTLTIKSTRGRIRDRNGELLAVSTPVDSLWMDPQLLCESKSAMAQVASALGRSEASLAQECVKAGSTSFRFLKRHMAPADASKILELNIQGLFSQREYKRYYPTGPNSAHIVGFTNIDDVGQEGLERNFDALLSGTSGRIRVVRDRKGRVIDSVDRLKEVEHGEDLDISIDSRIQYATRRALAKVVREFNAVGASAVVLDSHTGEILSMVNFPDYNPNRRRSGESSTYRNRAVTDLFEPGSTVKPFTVAMAHDSGEFNVDQIISTSPGEMKIGRHVIHDVHDYGDLSVSRVIIKSSNVGVAKIALQLSPQQLVGVLHNVGFGAPSGVELPGERAGYLPRREKWRPIEHATLSYGYGLSSTPIQLAQAYSVLASGGKLVPLTIRKRRQPAKSERVLAESVVKKITQMLELVVSSAGTSKRASVPHYRAAGKTGTSKKVVDGRYAANKYFSSFAGFAPASNPRFVMAVVVDEPRKGGYFGGLVAAPVFAEVMAETLRLYNVHPDKISPDAQHVARLVRPEGDV